MKSHMVDALIHRRRPALICDGGTESWQALGCAVVRVDGPGIRQSCAGPSHEEPPTNTSACKASWPPCPIGGESYDAPGDVQSATFCAHGGNPIMSMSYMRSVLMGRQFAFSLDDAAGGRRATLAATALPILPHFPVAKPPPSTCSAPASDSHQFGCDAGHRQALETLSALSVLTNKDM